VIVWDAGPYRNESRDARRRPTRTEPSSVLSGRTVAEVADQGPRDADA
jgi:hypothetical protein